MKKIIFTILVASSLMFTGCMEQPTPPELKANMSEQEMVQYNKDNAKYQQEKSAVDAQTNTVSTTVTVLAILAGFALAL